ncbi:unnamed protein product [Dovyalis caffra]|uniref:Uncharacterized protein n=1 Tax=Dovyalis caffra TaxID=77055 RepID=A0AAV1RDE5_9ROSI|nr:unnamed protein product [Dovyalis caffra]
MPINVERYTAMLVNVYITQGDHAGDGVTVSLVTPNEPGSKNALLRSKENLDQTLDSKMTVTHYELNPTKGHTVHEKKRKTGRRKVKGLTKMKRNLRR